MFQVSRGIMGTEIENYKVYSFGNTRLTEKTTEQAGETLTVPIGVGGTF